MLLWFHCDAGNIVQIWLDQGEKYQFVIAILFIWDF